MHVIDRRRWVLPTLAGLAPITTKRDVIHKTGSTQHCATPLQEDRATTTGDLHTKFREDRSSGSRDACVCSRTDRQTSSSQYSAPLPGRSNYIMSQSYHKNNSGPLAVLTMYCVDHVMRRDLLLRTAVTEVIKRRRVEPYEGQGLWSYMHIEDKSHSST